MNERFGATGKQTRNELQLDGTFGHAEGIDFDDFGDAIDTVFHDPLNARLQRLSARWAGHACAVEFHRDHARRLVDADQ